MTDQTEKDRLFKRAVLLLLWAILYRQMYPELPLSSVGKAPVEALAEALTSLEEEKMEKGP